MLLQGDDTEEKARQYGDDLGGQIKKGAADGKHWASKQVDNVKHQADKTREGTSHKASEAKHKVDPKVEDAKSGVSGAIESVKDTVSICSRFIVTLALHTIVPIPHTRMLHAQLCHCRLHLVLTGST